MPEFNEYTLFLKSLAEEAKPIFKKYFDPGGISAMKKADNSPVTECDLAVNALVIERVKRDLPGFGVLGEEDSFNEHAEKLIVVDPLDGTRMFAAGIPLFCFSAAVVEDGVPTSGVIMNPVVPRTLLAEKGKGTHLLETGKQVHVNDAVDFKGQIVHAGWGSTGLSGLIHADGGRTLMLYAVCESSSLLATGVITADIYASRHAHDIAAIKIIVEEAGGKVTDLEGNEQRYDRAINGALISNGVMHGKLLEYIKRAYGSSSISR